MNPGRLTNVGFASRTRRVIIWLIAIYHFGTIGIGIVFAVNLALQVLPLWAWSVVAVFTAGMLSLAIWSRISSGQIQDADDSSPTDDI